MSRLSSILLRSAAIAALSFAFAASAQASNLVQNGGFETGDFTNWTLGGLVDDNTYVGTGPNAPFDGSFAAQLGAVGSDNTLSQAIATAAGQNYVISYWHIFAPDAGPVGDFSVLWDGNVVHAEITQNPPTPQTWTEYSFQVTGTGADTLEFDSRNDPSYQGLDDVSLVAGNLSPVPLPASLPLFASVLASLGMFASRRKLFARN